MLSRLINALAARTRHHGGVTHAGNAARAGVPVVGLRPLRARYDAAVTTDGNRRHWANADGLSADAAASPEVRRVLRNRARYEVANNSYARGIVCTLANDVVGTGPRLQMLTGDPEADRRIEAAFADWACAVGLAAKLRTMRMARAESGESFALLARNPGNGSPVQLDVRLIEADQVATPDLRLNEPNAIDGIIFDEVGNPIEYHVLKRHPGAVRWTTGLQYDRIAAAVIIHYFRADRPGQSRGVPDITQALPLFAQLRRFTLAVISAAETAADFAGVLYTDAPANGEAEDVEPMDAIELEQRMLLTMPGGWKMAQLKAEQPATTYAEFNRELIATIAKVTAIVLGVGIALVVAGAAIVGLGTVFGSLATIVAGVGADGVVLRAQGVIAEGQQLVHVAHGSHHPHGQRRPVSWQVSWQEWIISRDRCPVSSLIDEIDLPHNPLTRRRRGGHLMGRHVALCHRVVAQRDKDLTALVRRFEPHIDAGDARLVVFGFGHDPDRLTCLHLGR